MKKVSQEKVTLIKSLRESGDTYRLIAKKTGLSIGTVARVYRLNKSESETIQVNDGSSALKENLKFYEQMIFKNKLAIKIIKDIMKH
jgi:hypothetical protein